MFKYIFAAAFILTTPAAANPDNVIPLRKSVTLSVGQSIIVHGFRGECGKRPTNVDPKRTRDTKLGVLGVGRWGVTKSRTCGGMTPAIEVIYKARKKGIETIEVRGEKIKVRVR